MSRDELERQARSQRIDPKLMAGGGQVLPFVSGKAFAEYGNTAAATEFETEAGPADYALLDHDEVLGVLEAKRVTVGPQGVLTQAARARVVRTRTLDAGIPP